MEQLEICRGTTMILTIIIFFIMGTVLGSFYNVVGYRLPKGQSIVNPKHSYCASCKKQLTAIELIPILSYLIQGGKCKNCKSHISILHPFIELVTGALFAVSFYSFGYSYDLIIALTLVSLFSVVIVSDLNYMIIPDEVTLIAAIIIIITNFMNLGVIGGILQLRNGLITFIVMYLIMKIGNFIFKKETLGGADIKLMFLSGLTLNPILGLLVIFIASAIALPASILVYVFSKDHMIPFGPFIVASILFFFLLKIDVSTFTNLINNLL